MTQPARFSKPVPYHYKRALVAAAMQRDIRQIDILTDTMALQGIVRPRKDDVIKPAHLAAARGLAG